jgi:fluoroacetyl-CoA thioesterase
MGIDIGLRGESRLTVSMADTAVSLGTGSLPLLSTSRLVTLCEQAAACAVERVLIAPQTTVGMRIQIDHLQPVAIDQTVTAEAVLEKVEGRRLTFVVSATDERGLVAAGKLVRVLVDTDQFMQRAK